MNQIVTIRALATTAIALEGSDLKCDRDMFVMRDKRRILPPPARMFLAFLRSTPVPAPSPTRP